MKGRRYYLLPINNTKPIRAKLDGGPEDLWVRDTHPNINGKGRREALGAEDPAREVGRLKKAAGGTEKEEEGEGRG